MNLKNKIALIGEAQECWADAAIKTIEKKNKCLLDWSYGLPGEKGDLLRDQLHNLGYFILYTYASRKRGGIGKVTHKAKIVNIVTQPSGMIECPDEGLLPQGFDIPDKTRLWMEAIEINKIEEPIPIESFEHYFDSDRVLKGFYLRNSLQAVHEEVSITIADMNHSKWISIGYEETLKELIVDNWYNLDFCKEFTIYEKDGKNGFEYDTGIVGRIDILAIENNTNDFVVIELKRGTDRDKPLAQIQRYMGWVKENLADPQSVNVKGIIIVGDKDPYLEYAVKVASNISVYQYELQLTMKELYKQHD